MIEVRWTSQAVEDVQSIYDFIARDSIHYAQLVIEKIIAAVDNIERFPLMGRVVPERGQENLRENKNFSRPTELSIR